MVHPRVITLHAFQAAVFAGACALASCAAEDPNGVPGTCGVQLAITSPVELEAPVEISALASITTSGSLSGFHQYTWAVLYDGAEPVAVETLGEEGEIARLFADRGGPYRVSVSAAVGETACGTADEVVNVATPGAPLTAYRLRFVPAIEHAVPVQERALEIPGGANYELGSVALDAGVVVSGQVRDDALAPVAAYLRAVGQSPLPGLWREGFADQNGDYQMRVLEGRYDILVVPDDDAHAPERFASVATPWNTLELAPGLPVFGSIVDAAGAAVADARVAVYVAEVPSTLGLTDGAGAFSVLARPGAPAALSVVLAQDSGRPSLSLSREQGVALDEGASPMTIAYTDGVASRALALEVRAADGGPVAGARVTFVARPMAGAGTLTLASGLAFELTGEARVSLASGADGALAAVLPEAVYDVVLEPAPGNAADAVTHAVVDMRAGQPDVVALAFVAPVAIAGRITDEGGAAVAGASVSATPVGILAQTQSARASVETDSSGRFVLTATPDTEYRLVIDGQDGGHARERLSITSPASGTLELGSIALARALEVRGRVTVPGRPGGAAGVVVQLLCADCPAPDASQPLAETVSDAFGDFSVPVPDPVADPVAP